MALSKNTEVGTASVVGIYLAFILLTIHYSGVRSDHWVWEVCSSGGGGTQASVSTVECRSFTLCTVHICTTPGSHTSLQLQNNRCFEQVVD